MVDFKHLKRKESCLLPVLQAFVLTAIIRVLFVFVAAEVPKAIDKELDARSAQAAAVKQGVSDD